MLATARFVAVLLGIVVLSLSGCGSSKPAVKEESASKTQAVPTGTELIHKLDHAIGHILERRLNSQTHNAWQVVHGILAFGPDFPIVNDGKKVAALKWLLEGGAVRGWDFVPGDKGLDSVLDEGSKVGQGHEDQWLGYLSQCGMKLTDKIVARGKEYTIADLVAEAQWDMTPDMEGTWTLMAASEFVEPGAKWKASDGQDWTIERLVRHEANQNLEESACGGTHRLYALAMAVKKHRAQGGAMERGWADAQQRIDESIIAARTFQQSDGSFSTEFFSRSNTSPELQIRLHSTGHIFEFLCVVVSDEQLQSEWMAKAANYLCILIEDTQDLDLECGALYHAAHGLILYRDRMKRLSSSSTSTTGR